MANNEPANYSALVYLTLSELSVKTNIDMGTLQLMEDKGFLHAVIDDGIHLYPSSVLDTFVQQYDAFDAYMQHFDLESGQELYQEDTETEEAEIERNTVDDVADEEEQFLEEDVVDAEQDESFENDDDDDYDSQYQKALRRKMINLRAEREHYKIDMQAAAEENARSAARLKEQQTTKQLHVLSQQRNTTDQTHQYADSSYNAREAEYDLLQSESKQQAIDRVRQAQQREQQQKRDAETYKSFGTGGLDYSKIGDKEHAAWVTEEKPENKPDNVTTRTVSEKRSPSEPSHTPVSETKPEFSRSSTVQNDSPRDNTSSQNDYRKRQQVYPDASEPAKQSQPREIYQAEKKTTSTQRQTGSPEKISQNGMHDKSIVYNDTSVDGDDKRSRRNPSVFQTFSERREQRSESAIIVPSGLHENKNTAQVETSYNEPQKAAKAPSPKSHITGTVRDSIASSTEKVTETTIKFRQPVINTPNTIHTHSSEPDEYTYRQSYVETPHSAIKQEKNIEHKIQDDKPTTKPFAGVVRDTQTDKTNNGVSQTQVPKQAYYRDNKQPINNFAQRQEEVSKDRTQVPPTKLGNAKASIPEGTQYGSSTGTAQHFATNADTAQRQSGVRPRVEVRNQRDTEGTRLAAITHARRSFAQTESVQDVPARHSNTTTHAPANSHQKGINKNQQAQTTTRKLGDAVFVSATQTLKTTVSNKDGNFTFNTIKMQQSAHVRPNIEVQRTAQGIKVKFANPADVRRKFAQYIASSQTQVLRSTPMTNRMNQGAQIARFGNQNPSNQMPFGTTAQLWNNNQVNATPGQPNPTSGQGNGRGQRGPAPNPPPGQGATGGAQNTHTSTFGSSANAGRNIRNAQILNQNLIKLEKQLGIHYGLSSLGRSVGLFMVRQLQLREADVGRGISETRAYTSWVGGAMKAAGARCRVIESAQKISINLLPQNITIGNALGALRQTNLIQGLAIDFNQQATINGLTAAIARYGQMYNIGDFTTMSAADIKALINNNTLTYEQKTVAELALALKDIDIYSQTAITDMMRQAGLRIGNFQIDLNDRQSVINALKMLTIHCTNNNMQVFTLMSVKQLQQLIAAGSLTGNDLLLANLTLALKTQDNLLSIMQKQQGTARFQVLRLAKKIFGDSDAFNGAWMIYQTLHQVRQAIYIAKLIKRSLGKSAAFVARRTKIPKVTRVVRNKANTAIHNTRLHQTVTNTPLVQNAKQIKQSIAQRQSQRNLKRQTKKIQKHQRKKLTVKKVKKTAVAKTGNWITKTMSKASAAISKLGMAAIKYIGIFIGIIWGIVLIFQMISMVISAIASITSFAHDENGVETDSLNSVAGKVLFQLVEQDQQWFASIEELKNTEPSIVAGENVYGYFDPSESSTHIIETWGYDKVDSEGQVIENGYERHYWNGDHLEIGPYSNAKGILSCAHVYMEGYYDDVTRYKNYCYGETGLWEASHWYDTTISSVYACPDGCTQYEYYCDENKLYNYINDPDIDIHISTGLVEHSEHGCQQCSGTDLTRCSGCITLSYAGGTVSVCPGHIKGCDNEIYVDDGSNSIEVVDTGTTTVVYPSSFQTHTGAAVASGQCSNKTKVYCGNTTYCPNQNASGICTGHWICNGHVQDTVNGTTVSCSNPKGSGSTTIVYCAGCFEYDNGATRCLGHKIDHQKCGGHKASSETVIVLTYGRYVCQGHCNGHIAGICLGHVDLKVDATIVGVEEGSKRLFEIDDRTITVETTEGTVEEKLWTPDNIEWALIIYSDDWYELYGISLAEAQGTPLSTQEINDILATLPEDTIEERRILLKWALESVGRISYYFGGKADMPGYDGNNFGTISHPDSSGRCIKGLDCSHWVDWVYWSALNNNLGNGYTGVLRSIGQGVSRNELLPGDILVNHTTNEDGTHSGHAALFIGWVDGKVGGDMIYVHETPENVTVTISKKTWDYYRRVIHEDGSVRP